MTIDIAGWWIMAIVAVGCAIGMISARNPVHSALWLVGNFIALGVIYLILAAPVLFAIQLIVYAGAIMVLFLFVIMFFMSPRAREWLRPALKGQMVIGGVLVVIFMLTLFFGLGTLGSSTELMIKEPRAAMIAAADADTGQIGNPRPLGNWLFTYHALPFELTSVLLLIAMIGALMVARDSRSEGREHVPGRHEPQSAEISGGKVKA